MLIWRSWGSRVVAYPARFSILGRAGWWCRVRWGPSRMAPCMKRWRLPIVTSGLFAHDVNVTMVERKRDRWARRLATMEWQVDKWD